MINKSKAKWCGALAGESDREVSIDSSGGGWVKKGVTENGGKLNKYFGGKKLI